MWVPAPTSYTPCPPCSKLRSQLSDVHGSIDSGSPGGVRLPGEGAAAAASAGEVAGELEAGEGGGLTQPLLAGTSPDDTSSGGSTSPPHTRPLVPLGSPPSAGSTPRTSLDGVHQRRQRPGTRPPLAPGPWRPRVDVAAAATLAALLLGVVAADMAKARLRCPSLLYWLAAASMVPVTLAALAAVRWRLLAKAKRAEAAGTGHGDGDVRWDERSTLLYPALCTGAGVAAGLCGVGGGVVKGERPPPALAPARRAGVPARPPPTPPTGPPPAPPLRPQPHSCWNLGCFPRWLRPPAAR